MSVSFSSSVIQNTVASVVKLFKKGKMIVPEFQRRYQYNDAKKMNLITSILVGISIDTITCVEESGIQKICDGMHRIVTLTDFLEDKFPFIYSLSKTNAKDLGIDKNLDGKYFSQFPVKLQEKIKQAPLYTVLVIPDDESNIPTIINSLMVAKNSCAENVPERRIYLNKKFIDDPNLIVPWSYLITNIKTDVNKLVYSQAVNTSEISSTFLLLMKFLDNNVDLLTTITKQVCTLSFSSKTKNGLVLDIQGALFWSALVTCNKAEVSWEDFLVVYRHVRPIRYGVEENTSYGKKGLSLLQKFNILSVLFSNNIEKRINKTKAIKEILEMLLVDSNIPDECKDRIESYL